MNPFFHDMIREKVVDPVLRDRVHPIKATIVSYNNYSNMARIRFLNPFGQGEKELGSVPLQLGSGGVHSAGPFPGDQVWVTFLHGNLTRPRIVSLADDNYYEGTREERLKHERQGTMILAKATQKGG